MKKLIVMILMVTILTSCSGIDNKDVLMIKPTEHSEETQKVLKLLEEDIVFLIMR